MKKIWNQDLYLKALSFAAEAHSTQKVPGTEHPYVVHVISVCMEVMSAIFMEGAADPDLAVQCALLHDTIEDSGVSPDTIIRLFGSDVAAGVSALSKNRSLPKEDRMSDSIYRIKKMPREIFMVKLADRITNLQPPPQHWDRDKISRYREEAEMILKHLGSASPYLSERMRLRLETYGTGSIS